MPLRRRGDMGAEQMLRQLLPKLANIFGAKSQRDACPSGVAGIRALCINLSAFVERILKKIIPVIRKETVKRLLIWVGWVLMIIAEAVLDSAE